MYWQVYRRFSLAFCCILVGWKLLGKRHGIELIDTGFLSSNVVIICLLLPIIASAAVELAIFTARYANIKTRIKPVVNAVIWTAAIAITLKSGGIYDYAAYKLQWLHISSGGSPWDPISAGVNAYGPVHSLFAHAYSIHDILPKSIFGISLLFLYHWLNSLFKSYQLLNFICCFGVYSTTIVFGYGFMDAIPSVATVVAIGYATRQRYFESALALTIGTASKFYPAVLLPLFLIYFYKSKGATSVVLFSFWVAVFTGMTAFASYLLWGDDIASPLTFASSRSASFLTFWRFLPAGFVDIYGKGAVVAIYLSFLVSISYKVMHNRMRSLPLPDSSTVILSSLFSMFYLGHQQFYLVLILMVPFLADSARRSTDMTSSRASTSINQLMIGPSLIVGWLSFVQICFIIYGELKPSSVSLVYDFLSLANSLFLILAALLIYSPAIRSVFYQFYRRVRSIYGQTSHN